MLDKDCSLCKANGWFIIKLEAVLIFALVKGVKSLCDFENLADEIKNFYNEYGKGE